MRTFRWPINTRPDPPQVGDILNEIGPRVNRYWVITDLRLARTLVHATCTPFDISTWTPDDGLIYTLTRGSQ